jgi:hypothetical protein
MIRRLSVAFAFVIAASTLAFASDVTGIWNGAVDTPEGPVPLSYTFAVDGEQVTGTATGPEGEIPIENGKIDGDLLTFTVTLKDGGLVVHEGTVTGDTMTVRAQGPWGEVSFNLQRAGNEDGQ